MPKRQYRDRAAEFHCQFPADPVSVPGIPLPNGSGKWQARPCYRNDFPLSDAKFSLPAGKTSGFYGSAILLSTAR